MRRPGRSGVSASPTTAPPLGHPQAPLGGRPASAWLIRRHIDRKGRFVWLEQPADCGPEMLGYDFEGAVFAHVGRRVTFATLLASFGLESDIALKRMGEVVHFLDVGGVPVAEAVGVEALLARDMYKHSYRMDFGVQAGP